MKKVLLLLTILAVATIGTATGEAAESETSVTTCVDWAYAQLGS